MSNKPRIYLAGPDVFFPDAKASFDYLIDLCSSFGLIGVPPSDGGISSGFKGTKFQTAKKIYDENIHLIKTSNGVVANLSAFRGIEPDSGTVFETAFATALNKPVIGYSNTSKLTEERVRDEFGFTVINGCSYDNNTGCMIEEFGLKQNLMLSCSFDIEDSAKEALCKMTYLLNLDNNNSSKFKNTI
jgi:nucleoside 2-deoxyribosyltransferase